MRVLVQEEVIACRILGDPFWQVFDFRRVSVRQDYELLFEVDFLIKENETTSVRHGPLVLKAQNTLCNSTHLYFQNTLILLAKG